MRGLIPYLSIGLIAIGVFGLLGLLARAGRLGVPKPGSQTLLLRYSPMFRGLTYVAAFCVPVGLTVLVTIFPPHGQARWYVFGLYVVVAVLGLPVVWEASRFYLFVTPGGLECRSPWRGVRYMEWDDLIAVEYSGINSWFVFRSAGGESIRVSGFVAGVPSVLAEVEKRIPPAALRNARAGYLKIGRPVPPSEDEPVLEARPPR